MAAKMGAPASSDPEVNDARQSINLSTIITMTAREFLAHHKGGLKKVSDAPITTTTLPMSTSKPKPEARKRTEDEIEAEIALLKALKPRVPSHSKFGDDNREQIQIQIDALENRWTEDDIELEFDTTDLQTEMDETEYDGDLVDNSNEIDELETNARVARDAINWRDGDSAEACSEGWSHLVKGR